MLDIRDRINREQEGLNEEAETADERRRINKERRESVTLNKNLNKPEDQYEALQELQTEKFIETARSFYNHREETNIYDSVEDSDILEKFYDDRTWGNYNTLSMGADVAFTAMEEDESRIQQFAYLQQTFERLPSFWNDPNRSFGRWLLDAGGAMVVDPVNLVGLGVGKIAAKESFSQVLKAQLKGKMAKEIELDILEGIAKESSKKALGKAVKKGAVYEGLIAGAITGAQDGLLQSTAINTGVQENYDLSQMGLNAAAGGAFGTLFGAATSAFSFKLTTNQMKNQGIRQLEDIHKYGVENTNGTRLFNDLLLEKDTKQLYKNMSKAEKQKIELSKEGTLDLEADVNTTIVQLRTSPKTSTGKPPQEAFNYDRINNADAVEYIMKYTREIAGNFNKNKISLEEMRKDAAAKGLDPDKVFKKGKKIAEYRDMYADVIAHRELMVKESADIRVLAAKLSRSDITPKERADIIAEIEKRDSFVNEIIDNQARGQENVAKTLTSYRVEVGGEQVARLQSSPTDPKQIKLKKDNPEEFYKKLAELDDDEQVIQALTHHKDFDTWDLAAEYVNNNLLSSPDTHILNITSGLTQTMWKPFVMTLRAANLTFRDRQRAASIGREAFNTFIQQIAYSGHALGNLYRGFLKGRPILDQRQLKVDSTIKQGNLQKWMNATAELLTQPLGRTGRLMQKYIVQPTTATVTAPLRVLSAGDEFLKNMFFKGRMAAQIHELIIRDHPDIINNKFMSPIFLKGKYKEKFREYEKLYLNEKGEAINVDDLLPEERAKLRTEDTLAYNTPLRYAQEGSYTQSARIKDSQTGQDATPNLTQGVLDATSGGGKWMRVFGLHFINTPSNLIRWNMQHLPILGRYQLEMRQLLRMKDGSLYNPMNPKQNIKDAIDPEAAAEATARIQAGYLVWTAAIYAAIEGKTTGGGSRDFRENEERKKATGWQEYSYRKEDGTYVSFNRLDPLAMPFGIAADLVDVYEDYVSVNEDVPEHLQSPLLEATMGAVVSMIRNMTSKFYTQNIVETANALLSDDFIRNRAPDRFWSGAAARTIFKFTPLSGSLRYANRIGNEHQTELVTFMDRLKRLDPATSDFSWLTDEPVENVMPARDMFGEKVPRNKGWLFGMEVTSSPFAWTKWSSREVSDFFADREFNYKKPKFKAPKTKLDLRSIKDPKTRQSAYDYMMEARGAIKDYSYKGQKNLSLKEYIENIIRDKDSGLYDLPTKEYTLKDYQQDFILDIINSAHKTAWAMTRQKFPIIDETLYKMNLFEAQGFKNYQNRDKFIENIWDYED